MAKKSFRHMNISDSGKVSLYVGVEDGRQAKITAGANMDATLEAYVKFICLTNGWELVKLPAKSGQYFQIRGTVNVNGVVKTQARVFPNTDWGNYLSGAIDGEYQGKPQRTYWFGEPGYEQDAVGPEAL